MTMASLPKACRAVLAAPSPASELAVTVGGNGTAVAASLPAAAAPAAPENEPTVDPGLPPTTSSFAPTPKVDIPRPGTRPRN